MAEEKTTKPTFGNTVGREEQCSSTSEWVANEKDPNGSWATSRASSKVTVTGRMIMSAEPESSMQRAGRTPGASSFEAVKLNPRDQTSIRIVAQTDELFAIDQKARKENLNPSDRHLLRLEKAKPLLEQDQDSDPGGSWGCTSQERPSQGM
jgi:hypothetical protein